MSGLLPRIPELFDNQKQSIEFEAAHERVVDASDPGTGKTRARLEAFASRRSHGGGCALVLAPKSLLHSAWVADCRRYTPWLVTSAAYADNRAQAFAKKADIYVTNHDAVKWLAAQPPEFFARFDTLIIDESGAFKHHSSKRSKALAKIKRHFRRRVIMNGTLTTNGVLDAWHQVNIVDDGERLGRSFFAFRNAVCVSQQVGPSVNMVKWSDKPNAEQVVAELVKDIAIRHELKDCQDIPENHKFVVPYQLPGKLEAKYREMEELAVAQMKDGTLVEGVNAAAVITKLLQIASGAVYDGDGNYHVLDTSRYELVMDLAEERKHVVVFFNWSHQRDMLMEEAKRRNLTHTLIDGTVGRTKRAEVVDAYQAGLYRVLFAHPQSAAHGLTLTKGTRTIWASPTYNLEHYVQGNHRIDRAGQTSRTDTASVLAEGTIEEHVYSVMTEKGGKLRDLLEYLRK